jgi:hypothetical protein
MEQFQNFILDIFARKAIIGVVVKVGVASADNRRER